MPDLTIGNVLGGVAYSYPPTDLPSVFLADAQNIVPTLSGYATKRGGSSLLNSTAYGTNITSFHEFLVAGTSYKYASQGTVIGIYNSGTSAFDNHITGLTSGLYGQWINYGDYAIYCNGTDKVQKSDGTTGNDLTADLAGIPGGQCIAEWAERVWLGGYTGDLARLTGSALRAPTDFSTSGADGFWQGHIGSKKDPITGLFPFYDVLLIGKRNQIWQLTGAPETNTSTFRLIPLQTKQKDSIGFTSKTAITQVGNDVLFLDGFDIKALSGMQKYGDVESASIIANIRDYFRSSSGAALDKDYLHLAHFYHYKHKEQVWCSIPTGASTRWWLIIDYSNQGLRAQIGLPKYSFYPMYGYGPLCFGGVEDGSRMNVYSGSSDGYVRQMDTGINDSAVAIDAHLTWGLGYPGRNVSPTFVNLAVEYDTALTLAPSYAMGLETWEDVTTAGNFTAMASEDVTGASWRRKGNRAYKKLNSFMYNTDRSFLFKLRHNTASQNFEMRSSLINYTTKSAYYG
jgi:hypothetical protein